MLIETTIAAGERKEYFDPGDFFRLLEAEFPVTVSFYRNGAEVAESEGVSEGYAERFRESTFDRFTITSATAQLLRFVARLGNDVLYDTPPNGDVSVTNNNGAFTHDAHTVTNASATLKAAKPTRRYLLIQNNNATGSIFVRFDGAAATTANGIKIEPGGSVELQGFVPTGAIVAIGDIASNANVLTLEG
jgi:hypothetical protein